MKTLMAMMVAALSLTTVGPASAQNGGMMNGGHGGMWGGGWMGGYGGLWGLILLAVVVGFIFWLLMKRRK